MNFVQGEAGVLEVMSYFYKLSYFARIPTLAACEGSEQVSEEVLLRNSSHGANDGLKCSVQNDV